MKPKSKHSEHPDLLLPLVHFLCFGAISVTRSVIGVYEIPRPFSGPVAVFAPTELFYVPTALVNQARRNPVGPWRCTERTIILPLSHKAYPKIRSARLSL